MCDHLGWWHDVPDVVGGTNYGAWNWQRYFVDHLCRYYRRTAVCLGTILCLWSFRCDQPCSYYRRYCDGHCDDCIRGVHGTVLAQGNDPIPPPSGWHEDYGRPEFPFADQSKPSGRYPGNLCVVFAAIAKYHFYIFRRINQPRNVIHLGVFWSRSAAVFVVLHC